MSDKPPPQALSAVDKQALLRRVIAQRKSGRTPDAAPPPERAASDAEPIPESFYRVDRFPHYHQMQLHRALADRLEIASPFFQLHEGVGRDTTVIDGREQLNFSTYNYLGLNGDERINRAAAEAAQRYGTSASASRLVGGERPPHRALERALADLHHAADAVAFVSGFGANVSIVSTLVGAKDLVLLDKLVHNSIIQGAKLSGATIQTFAHNDWEMLDRMLAGCRRQYERVLIAVEGIYSMDGDICPLPELIEIKHRHKALLMVDEAHSIGALGRSGRGVGEHFGVAPGDVDVWMGTLSKTLAGCGGYAAGSTPLVELLKYGAPGFVYSVGLPPPMAAAALTALELMLAEPERIAALRANGARFLSAARQAGLDTGISAGINVIPIMVGGSVRAGKLANALARRGIQVNPIIFPAVEEKSARLRFFLSSDHRAGQIDRTIAETAAALAGLDLDG